jgi:transcriptional regulator with XRE-family HTH domain
VPLQEAFGQVLRDIRLKSGLSQEKLALASGLDRTFISLLERGLRQPSLTTLVTLAGPLQTTATQLVAETERRASLPQRVRK